MTAFCWDWTVQITRAAWAPTPSWASPWPRRGPRRPPPPLGRSQGQGFRPIGGTRARHPQTTPASPSAAPAHTRAERHTAEIAAPLDYHALERHRAEPWLRRSAEYEQAKERMKRALLDLVERHRPGFRDLVEYSELATPLTFELFTGAPSGYAEQGAGAAVASLADIDWAATISGGLVPDYTTFRPNDTSYPAMLVTGDLVLQDAVGYGLLIVTGDLSLEGASDTFHGVLLVGGGIDFVANSITLDGVVKSGLNEQLQGAAGKTSTDKLGTSRVRMQYDSCEITKALQSLQGFAPIRNARVDTWGTY